jgi:hypothetical protein
MQMELENNNESSDNFNTKDQFWISKNNGLQLLELKYPTFGEHTIDSQIKLEITYDNLISDINSVLDVLTQYQSLYKTLIDQNKGNIIKVFLDHNLKYLNYGIHAKVLQREIILIILKLRATFDGDKKAAKTIEQDYEISEDGYINAIIDSDTIKLLEQRDELADATQYLKVIKRNEDLLLRFSHRPSISSLALGMKYLKSIIENICIIILALDMEDWHHKDIDDLLLDLFHNVRVLLTVVYKSRGLC